MKAPFAEAKGRPVRGLSAGLVLALLALGSPGAAQTVVGRFLAQESGVPLAAALVTLVDSAGGEHSATLTDSAGSFALRAPSPGLYRVRGEHIGRETVSSRELVVLFGVTASVTLEARVAAVLLQPLTIAGRGRCKLRPELGEPTAQLWEEARKALRASRLARRSQSFVVRRFERVLSPRTFLLLRESERALEGTSVRPIASTSEAELDRLGYVRREGKEWVFWAPDEEVLLSEGFLDHHCLRLRAGGKKMPGLVGLDFEPLARKHRDIKGTIWLHAGSAEPVSAEFAFTNVPWEVPPAAAGGYVKFFRLPSGSRVISYWYVRMPVMSLLVWSGPLVRGGATPRPREVLARIYESGAELLDGQGNPLGMPR